MWCKGVCAGPNVPEMLSWDDVLVGSSAIIMCVPLISKAQQFFAVMDFEGPGQAGASPNCASSSQD